MRVLHIYSGNLYGGVETLLVTLARWREFNSAMEAEFALCFDGRLSKELKAVNAEVHRLGETHIRRPDSIWRARARLRGLLRRRSFDLAICHSAWPQAIFGPAVRSAGVPLVFWLHNPADGRHWLERWARLVEPDLAICNSRFTAASLPALYPKTRIGLVHLPVPDPQVNCETDRGSVRDELKTPHDALVIIQVARMEARKGQELHLMALGRLIDLKGWICWQVGGPQRPKEEGYFQSLKEVAEQLGIRDRIRFAGERSDVARLLAAADICCQPSHLPEAFGISVVEAMYAGLPVVAAAMGSVPELLDSGSGMLVQPGDVEALAACLRDLIEGPELRARLGAAASERAKLLCDPAAQMARLHREFSSLLGREARNGWSG